MRKGTLKNTPTLIAVTFSLISLWLPARPALAEDPILARISFKQGNAALKKGDYETALEAFKTSYRAKPKAIVLFNIARCQQKLGKYRAAIESFEEYLAKAKNKRSVRCDQARAAIAEMRPLVPEPEPEPEPKPAPAVLRINCSAAGAVVVIDGADKPEPCPFEGPLPPGEHSVVVTAEGMERVEQRVELTAGEKTNLSVALRAVPPSSQTHPPEPEEPPGPEVSAVQQPVIGTDDENAEPILRKGLRITGWSAVALGVVSGGVGTVFGIKYNKDVEAGDEAAERYDKAVTGSVDAIEAEEDHDDIRKNKLPADTAGMIIGFTGAGVFTVTGAVLLFLGYRGEDENQPASVSAGPRGLCVRF